jgi:hypothetical protein
MAATVAGEEENRRAVEISADDRVARQAVGGIDPDVLTANVC